MKTLVTGGAGFIGSNLVDALIARGDQVSIIDDLSTGKESYLNSRAKFFHLDINSEKVADVFAKESFDQVFHLAAQIDVRISVADAVLDNRINLLGGINILANCRSHNVKKIVFSSTGGAVYGDTNIIPTPESVLPAPISPYGIHKLAFEKYLNYYYQVYGQNYTALRFANVYGQRQFKGGEAGVIAIFTENAVNEKTSIVNGDGLQTRDYVYVDDVVNAMILAALSDYVGELNIGTGVETNLLELIAEINDALGTGMDFSHSPAKEGEQLRSCLDVSSVAQKLGWKPQIDLKEGVRRTVEWTKSIKQ